MRKIAENYKLPYYTLSPTYSVCADHGYLAGEVYTCPHCGKPTEVYSRITGYYRPVQNWNDGKAQEFKDRKVYEISRSRQIRQEKAGEGPAAEKKERKAQEQNQELLLFATATCPIAGSRKKLLKQAGLSYRKVLAEQEPELASRYGITQAPTLAAGLGEGALRVTARGPIREFIRSCSQKLNQAV